jgi:molybdopterin-containing oxidoreductase family membrane subunit
MVGFAYSMEFFIAWYSSNDYELYAFKNRAIGPYWWAYWIMISCNVLSPQLFWSRAMRTSPFVIFVVSVLVTIGMWFERFVIIVTSLHRAYIPGEWGMFFPTPVDIMIFAGSFGVFLTLFLLFLRVLPVFAMAELKAVMPQADPHYHPEGAGAHAAAKGGH